MPQDHSDWNVLHAAAGSALASYLRLVRRTSVLVTDPPDHGAFMAAHHPFILSMWHGQFMMLPAYNVARIPLRIIVARHGDAEVLGRMLTRFDMGLIRGAGSGDRKRDRGGAHALRAAITALDEGLSFAMTADVPPGPALRCGMGIVTLARLSGCPILPVAIATSRYHVFNTWSRFCVNLPFSRVGLAFGAPILVPRKANSDEQERYRLVIEEAMNRATERAYELAGARGRSSLTRTAAAGPAEPGLSLKAYRGLTTVLRPIAPAILRYRASKGKEDSSRRPERFGTPSRARPPGRLAWVHAASVGETNSVIPLIREARKRWPDLSVLLTTGTVTSARLAAERLQDAAIHQYVPLDAPNYTRRFLDHWKPQLALFVESELWPNLVLETHARGIPMMLVNARMSKRSFGSWRKRAGSAAAIFGRFQTVLAQNELLARRFTRLGARSVDAIGNLKFDSPPPPVDQQALRSLKDAIGNRRLLLAASTHQGEEETIGAVCRMLQQKMPDLMAIIVPRHPERGTAIAEALEQKGLSVAQRSRGALPEGRHSIYVADTLGELGTFFSVSPFAFIGGSLIPHGGQNPIEAVKLGCGVITGPHWHNFKDAYQELVRQKGCRQVASAEELARTITELSTDQRLLEDMRERAHDVIGRLGGALDKTLDAVARLLPDGEALRRAS